MQIRRDPVTQSWVVSGQREFNEEADSPVPLDPGSVDEAKSILTWPAEGTWQVRVIPHPNPLYRVENDPGRLAEGIYDKMGPLGAHEVVVETRQHDKKLSQLGDDEIDKVLWVWASRIADLKKDARFKYVSVFKNQGALAGEEWVHSHSEVTATIFVPRRIKYELTAAHEWYKDRERCVFFEVWVMHRRHNHLFEQPRPGSNRRQLGALLGRVLRRLDKIAPAFHLVVHTAPNTRNKKGELSGYWKTLADDYHWHIEIMPILEKRSKSYSIKEVYFNAVLPEQAAEQLRAVDANS